MATRTDPTTPRSSLSLRLPQPKPTPNRAGAAEQPGLSQAPHPAYPFLDSAVTLALTLAVTLTLVLVLALIRTQNQTQPQTQTQTQTLTLTLTLSGLAEIGIRGEHLLLA